MNDTSATAKRTLTIVIPALNEEHNITATVEELLPVARVELDGVEVILVNDGSHDQTGDAMDRLAREHAEITVIHHRERAGVGASYKEGASKASMNYVTLVPGDHEVDPITWPGFFRSVGKQDLVIGYRVNQNAARPLYRVVLSRLYTRGMKGLFGLRVRDFHSLVVYPAAELRSPELRFVGYTYQLEMLVTLFRRGFTFVEVPIYLLLVDMRSSRSLSFRTLRDVVSTSLRLLFKRRTPRAGSRH